MNKVVITEKIEKMIDTIRYCGIDDPKIFSTMRKIPRHYFIRNEFLDAAYDDCPLPIGNSQTISQPFTVAFMLHHAELKQGISVVEIGTGSGWSSCLAAELVRPSKVISLEIIGDLAEFANKNIEKVSKSENISFKNLEIINSDGSLIFKKGKKFDRILFTAACPRIHPHFIEQLNDKGILIAPFGSAGSQQMIKIIKSGEIITEKNLGFFSFVPLTGKYGF